MRAELVCEVHEGPLRERDDGILECPGFDGEPCRNLPRGMPRAAAIRVASGATRWPGVTVREVTG